MDDLVVRTDERDGPTVLVEGVLDMSTLDTLERAIAALVHQRQDICLDLRDLTFCDSAGLQVLVSGYRKALDHGVRFEIRAASRSVTRLLEITGLRDLLGPAPD